VLLHRSRMNGLAAGGRYSGEAERRALAA
jgi:hypothetical protein